jgi:hypothetical protein
VLLRGDEGALEGASDTALQQNAIEEARDPAPRLVFDDEA